MCGSFSPHQAILRYQVGVLQFNSILTLFIWSPHRLRAQISTVAPLFSHQSQVQAVTCASDQQAVDQFPSTPSSGSVNLLECLIELRKTVYFLDYQLVIKEYNSGAFRWKRCTGEGIQEGMREFPGPLLAVHHSLHTSRITTRKLSESHPFGVLCRHGCFNHWPLVIYSSFNLSPPHRWGGEWDLKFQPFHLNRLFPWVFKKSPH